MDLNKLNDDDRHIQKINDMFARQKIIDNEARDDNTDAEEPIIKNIETIYNKLNLTLVEKNTYNGTLPSWFTLPADAIDPTISVCGGGGGGGGSNDPLWGTSGAGGSAGETIWEFPLNPGDTVYSVIGAGGNGGQGDYWLYANPGSNGSTTIVEGSANFPAGGLRAHGGRGGKGARSDVIARGGQWVHSGNPYAIAGQSGGDGGFRPNTLPQNGWPCYSYIGGKAGSTGTDAPFGLKYFGGGGGGASMIANGGNGGRSIIGLPAESGYNGTRGSGGGGAGSGSDVDGLKNGGKGGDGWVRVKYYV